MERSSFHSIRSILMGVMWNVVFIAVFAVSIYFAWNMTMPDLFGTREMSIKNAAGAVRLLIAVSILLRDGFGRRHASKLTDISVRRRNEAA